MNHRCIASLLLLFLSVKLVGQTLENERKFIRHLTNEGLLTERLYVLNQLSDSTSTLVKAEKAWTWHALGHYTSALRIYNTVPFDSLQKHGFAGNYLRLLCWADSLPLAERYAHRLNTTALQDTQLANKIVLAIRLMRHQYPLANVQELPENLRYSYAAYNKALSKSAFVATVYSILVPGLGKVYLGKPRQGWNMLLANLFFGLQAAESYVRAGPQSLRFIAFGSLFAVFYTGNIYGTVKGLKKTRKDMRLKLKYELEEYYLSDYALHPSR